MRTSEEIRAFLLERIGHIYQRPLMYGRSLEGVDLILHWYHELLAFIEDKEDENRNAVYRVHDRVGCQGAHSFSSWLKKSRPVATEDDRTANLVEWWKQVDRGVGLPIPGSSDAGVRETPSPGGK